uniref:Uncharacterized protein n=1 Tax=Anguilla anguilla TaxID=7936 RepID=A0A0E9WGC6_ANGAN
MKYINKKYKYIVKYMFNLLQKGSIVYIYICLFSRHRYPGQLIQLKFFF